MCIYIKFKKLFIVPKKSLFMIKDKPYFVFGIIIISCILFLILFFDIGESFKEVNNLDLLWLYYLQNIYLLGISLFDIIMTTVLIITILVLYYEKDHLKQINIDHVLIGCVILCIVFTIPSLYKMYEQNQMTANTMQPYIEYFEEQDNVHIALENYSYEWKYIYADFSFWLPDIKVDVLTYKELQSLSLHPYDYDYIISPSILPPMHITIIKEFYELDTTWYIFKFLP